MTPSTDSDSDATASESYLSHLYSFLSPHSHDRSGDIAPGSLDSPHIFPNAVAPESSLDKFFRRVCALVHGANGDQGELGYERKELEMRRPTGSRRW